MTHCYSCGAGVEKAEAPEKAYCKYCLDDQGNLKSKEDIKVGIAGWLRSWTDEKLDDATAILRAEKYMESMPEWAGK